MRLQLSHLRLTDPRESEHAVGPPPGLELVEPGKLGRLGRDDQLPAALVRDLVALAEGVEPAHPLHAQARLQRARAVVDAGVDHARVGPGLVTADVTLALEHGDAQMRLPGGELVSPRQPDDPASDNRDVAAINLGGAHRY